MKNYRGLYTIEDIRNLSDNSVHERAIRKKGQEVYIDLVEIGIPLYLDYQDGRGLKTSQVKNVQYIYSSGILRVFTMNTLYVFKETTRF